MLIDLTEDTLGDLISQNDKVVVSFQHRGAKLQNNETKIQKIGFRKRNSFVLIDAENSPESRKLANVSNLPTFATL
jgi:rRNA pseudouridine-1189 N-methylase Emg1 (Nep1/Mra1 family)